MDGEAVPATAKYDNARSPFPAAGAVTNSGVYDTRVAPAQVSRNSPLDAFDETYVPQELVDVPSTLFSPAKMRPCPLGLFENFLNFVDMHRARICLDQFAKHGIDALVPQVLNLDHSLQHMKLLIDFVEFHFRHVIHGVSIPCQCLKRHSLDGCLLGQAVHASQGSGEGDPRTMQLYSLVANWGRHCR